jgi:hypothetical protein
MTEALEGANGPSAGGMTTSGTTAQGSEAEKQNAPQKSPQEQQQDRAPRASSSEHATEAPKKRRKVNHGAAHLRILQTFGEPQHLLDPSVLPYCRIRDLLTVGANLARPAYDLRSSKCAGAQSSLPPADLAFPLRRTDPVRAASSGALDTYAMTSLERVSRDPRLTPKALLVKLMPASVKRCPPTRPCPR